MRPFPVADIAKITKASVKKMRTTSKTLLGVAVALSVLVIATVSVCRSAATAQQPVISHEAR